MKKSDRFWDDRAHSYDRAADAQFYARVVEITRKHVGPGDVVLDYGCGTGIVAHELAPHVRRVHGLDTSAKMIALAKSKAAQRGCGNVDFAQSTIFDPSYERAAVDVVLAINVLHLLPSTAPAVRRVAELLRPGGLFISATPCVGERMTLVQRALVGLFAVLTRMGLVPYIHVSGSRELDRLVTAEGALQIVETDTLVHGIPNRVVVARKV